MRLLKRIGITLAGILLGIIGGIAIAAFLGFLSTIALLAKENTKREAHCPICNEKMKLIEIKQISAMYECSKHGQFIVAFLEESDE